ncbi:PDZ and LIM domain protein Zasp-like isoform X2 [Macrosteles quadrilineatus]|uniref:PDZ and LIM domain protein Zasp-like isoform X2 n=1 Tax=Macrosteles quadrilineatus TaxID=74068 RepID=UPI0023E0981B|nr:PDZ and LIM domain protein Zasp-like isoform X2 [Macrosteles quadrilineatus]
MAGLITVRLHRNDAQPWGFRLQGGKDFGTPLLIQKVNGGSLAEKAGLQVADAVIKVNGQDVYSLRHKDAQDSIVKAGNSMEIIVSRGPGGTWKPSVTPVGNIPSPSPVGGAPAPVTKTSLAYKGPPAPAIPGYNTPAKPFSPQLNGVGVDPERVKSIASKQYNNPVGLYSDQNIAETLSAQAEVLAGGVLGVNFMKNEKTKFDASHSEVLKMVQEIDNEPRSPEPVEPTTPVGGGVVIPPPVTVSGIKHVAAPENKPPSTTGSQAPLQPGQNICADCERLIVGVFVRIKDKNLHVDCFKCATCGTSLKNVGYYNINNKLYCDIHAKLAARANPPGANLDPITIPPGGSIPSGAISSPLAHGGPTSPQPGTMAPLPFHAPRLKPSHVNPPRSFKPPSSAAPPKPFGAPPAPASFSAPAPPPSFAPAPPSFAPAPSVTSPPSKPFSSVQFNPPSAPAPAPAPFGAAPAPPSSFPKTLPGHSESFLPSSQSFPQKTTGQVGEIEDMTCCMDKSKRMSVCSSEVCNLSDKRTSVQTMAPLAEDPVRASPVPFRRGEVVSESYGTAGQETLKQTENFETSDEGNVHVTRKTKVEESFVRSQKMYTAEISSSQLSHMRAASPELEQIMTRKQVHQSYETSRLTPQPKPPQSERCLTPEIENLMEKPHGSWSPMPPACFVRPISPHATISFPPDVPNMHPSVAQPRTATPEQFQGARETVERFVDHSKHVQQTQAVTQSYQHQQQQQTFTQQQQQYTPRFDMSESFSAYNVKASSGNGYNNGNPSHGQNGGNNTGNNGNHGNNNNPTNHHNSGGNGNGNPGNHNGNPGNHNGNGNPGNGSGNGNPGRNGSNNGNGNGSGNGNPGRNGSNNGNENPNKGDGGNPNVTEPDSEAKYSRKSSGQSEKSRKSTTEEETTRRVFTDFGGPQVMTSLNVESTTEGGVEKTSVTKSEKMEYSSCEFESSRKSTILNKESGKSEGSQSTSEEPRKQSYPKFTAEASVDEEETVTKSQVEQIIKQELNKVFQMAQSMDKTNLNQMYDQQSQQSSRSVGEVVKATEQSSRRVDQSVSSSQYQEKKSFSGEAITKTGKLTSGLTIAPERTFTPQPLESNYPLSYQNIPTDFPPPRYPPGEPKPDVKPGYLPVTGSRDSPLLQALTIASDRPYSPLPCATIADTPPFISAPKQQASSMLEALTTAPTAPFAFGESNLEFEASTRVQKTTSSKHESIQKFAPKPSQGAFKPIPAGEPDSYSKYASLGQSVERSTVKSYQPVTDELKSAFKSTSKVQSQKTESEIQQSVKTHESSLSASRIDRPLTPSGLHPPDLLPYYQRNIGEIPLAHRSNSPVPHQIKAPELKPPRPDSVPHPTTERRGSVKALSEAYTQQIEALNNKFQTADTSSSVSYMSAGAYSSGSVTKAYSYEQDHKSMDTMGYQPSPLAGKRTPLAGERTIPKCSSPVMGKLDHTKQVFKPSVPSSSFQSPIADQASLRQAPPFFTQEKQKPPTPWVVVKEDKESVNSASFKLPLPKPSKPTLPTFPIVNKAPAFPEPPKPPSVLPDAGPGAAKGSTTAGTTAPRRGRGVLNAAVGAGGRVPLCGSCNSQIRGPFITALGKIWCPDHFVCVNAQCRRPLQDIGFVEEEQGLYCEYCFEQYLAPSCNKCNAKIKGDCLNAIGKHFHPECFTCAYCGKLFGNSPFFLEDALPYCEADWNELFTTKCFSCGFPIEAGDRWVEALNNNYHSQCFSCTMCKKNLEGQSFFAKGGRPFCKNHAR